MKKQKRNETPPPKGKEKTSPHAAQVQGGVIAHRQHTFNKGATFPKKVVSK